MRYAGILYPQPLTLQQATANPYHHRRHSNTVLAQCLWGLWVLVRTSFVWTLWASLVGMGLILNAVSPLLPSGWGFSFALGCGVSFFGGIQHSQVKCCLAVSCNFGVLAGEDECMSFYSAILGGIRIIWLYRLAAEYSSLLYFLERVWQPIATLTMKKERTQMTKTMNGGDVFPVNLKI